MTHKLIRAAAVAAALSLVASRLSAQAALGSPFIRDNTLSFRASELTRTGAAEMTTTFGGVYGHRFGQAGAATRVIMQIRASARPFDDVQAAVLDAGATVGISRQVTAVSGLQMAASAGLGMMGWADDVAKTGRLLVTIPVNAGLSYDLHVKGATISPFAMGTAGRYDLRTSLDDVRQSLDRGWDASYTTGVSLRLQEVVLTSARIVGEYGMPNRSRWTFSAGVSF